MRLAASRHPVPGTAMSNKPVRFEAEHRFHPHVRNKTRQATSKYVLATRWTPATLTSRAGLTAHRTSPQVEGALNSSGAGYSSGGTITTATSGEVKFSNSSFAMDQPEVIAVTLQADREVNIVYFYSATQLH